MTLQQTYSHKQILHLKNGFNDSFKKTLNGAGITRNYLAFGDSRKCEKTKIYNRSIEKNVDEKLYGDGYRCGVKQASNATPKINKDDATRQKNKNKETARNDSAISGYKKALEQQNNQDNLNKEFQQQNNQVNKQEVNYIIKRFCKNYNKLKLNLKIIIIEKSIIH